jgi:hypothetical protein
MKKLRLRPDELTVESFEPPIAGGDAGTVHGADATLEETCPNSCNGTCRWQTCNVPWQCPYP